MLEKTAIGEVGIGNEERISAGMCPHWLLADFKLCMTLSTRRSSLSSLSLPSSSLEPLRSGSGNLLSMVSYVYDVVKLLLCNPSAGTEDHSAGDNSLNSNLQVRSAQRQITLASINDHAESSSSRRVNTNRDPGRSRVIRQLSPLFRNEKEIAVLKKHRETYPNHHLNTLITAYIPTISAISFGTAVAAGMFGKHRPIIQAKKTNSISRSDRQLLIIPTRRHITHYLRLLSLYPTDPSISHSHHNCIDVRRDGEDEIWVPSRFDFGETDVVCALELGFPVGLFYPCVNL